MGVELVERCFGPCLSRLRHGGPLVTSDYFSPIYSPHPSRDTEEGEFKWIARNARSLRRGFRKYSSIIQ